jgi:GGDEF domain-containing protein
MTARELAIATIGGRSFAVIAKNAGEEAAIRAAWHRVLAEQHQQRAEWARAMKGTP